MERKYIAIDLKSFYASVECIERRLDPLKEHLVVADESRTDKTICLAVSPALKAFGIPGRARLFEVRQKAKQCGIDFIAATPRMSLYMEYSMRIYKIYLKYISEDDIHVYSIDEVFMDVTDYLNTYRMTARELASKLVSEVYRETKITATAGIGTNLYLAKVAMDIVAKHIKPDENGVRMAELNELDYRRLLWTHRPLTDFWRVGTGYAKKLEKHGLYTMGDIARCSLGGDGDFYNEDLLYDLFVINAELLIDHAWGYESARISDIKAFVPENNSLASGQVLSCGYDYEKARLIIKEMSDSLSLDMVAKKLVCDQVVLYLGYDRENLDNPERMKNYDGEIVVDYYGRMVPAPATGSVNLPRYTSSARLIRENTLKLFDEIADERLLIKRINLTANHVIPEAKYENLKENTFEQLELFTDYGETEKKRKAEEEEDIREKRLQEAMLSIKNRYGKNAILKGMNLEEGATAIERNSQIGGHKA